MLCTRGDPAAFVYNVVEGVACSYRKKGSGRRVLAFLYPGDLIGLARHGTYVNSVETLSPVTVFRIPIDQLVGLANRDAAIAWMLLCKLTQVVREAQHHTLVVSHPHATVRIAMFLAILEEQQAVHGGSIYLPVCLSEVAEYLNLSRRSLLAAITTLVRVGIIAHDGRRSFRVTHRGRFNRMVNEHEPPPAGARRPSAPGPRRRLAGWRRRTRRAGRPWRVAKRASN
jgi:CRP/FNR family transcriptional regulator